MRLLSLCMLVQAWTDPLHAHVMMMAQLSEHEEGPDLFEVDLDSVIALGPEMGWIGGELSSLLTNAIFKASWGDSKVYPIYILNIYIKRDDTFLGKSPNSYFHECLCSTPVCTYFQNKTFAC